jgi:hypothetical protein
MNDVRFGGDNIAMSVTDLGGGSIARPYPPPLRSKNLYHYIIVIIATKKKTNEQVLLGYR